MPHRPSTSTIPKASRALLLSALATAIAVTGCSSDDLADGDTSGTGATGTGGTGGSGTAGAGGEACEADVNNDPLNCGACGHDCEGGSCEAGRCGVVQIADYGDYVMSLNDTHVYYGGEEGLTRIPVGGGEPEVLAPGVSVSALSLDSTHAYASSCGAVVWSVDLSTGAATELATAVGGCSGTAGIAQNDSAVFFKTQESVISVPKAGGAPLTITTLPYLVQGVAVDASSVFMGSYDGVYQAALSGGAGNWIAPGDSVADVDVDDTHVYFAGLGDGVYRAPKSNPSAVELISEEYARHLWLTDSYVYWASKDAVLRAALDTLQVEQLAEAFDPTVVVSDDTRVFWSSRDNASGYARVYKLVL